MSSTSVRPGGTAAPRPIVIYDGDCGICTRLAAFVRRRLRPSAAVRASQELDLATFDLTVAECERALQFVDGGGRIYAAQDAVARLLLHSRPIWRPAGHLLRIPGVNALAGVAYRWVAGNRHRLPGGTSACMLPGPADSADRSAG